MLRSIKIKVCGVTRGDDLRLLADLGVDAVGLNFYPDSPRFLRLDYAQKLMDLCPDSLVRVGVFVNASSDVILAAADRCGLQVVQLHGEESPALLEEIAARAPRLSVIRSLAWRSPAVAADEAAAWLSAAPSLKSPLGWLIDAHSQQQRGGTGQTWRWSELGRRPGWLLNRHWLLAGGLTAENVAEAIRQARPDGVDAASGVEKQPGVKDPDRLRRFVDAAKSAFEGLAREPETH